LTTLNLSKLESVQAGCYGDLWRIKDYALVSPSEEKNEQVRLTLIRGGENIRARMKKTNFNEAVVYHKMQADESPLLKFVPKFYKALDKNLNEIPIGTLLLSDPKISDLDTRYPEIYAIFEDIEAPISDGEKPKPSLDLKFVKPSLLYNQQEGVQHCANGRPLIYAFFKILFFKLSQFSVALLNRSKNFFSIVNVIRSIYCALMTKRKLRECFKNLSPEQLQQVYQRLTELGEAIAQSRCTATGASLLLSVHGNGLHVHLIDFAHGMHQDEGIEGFNLIRSDMGASIADVRQIATDILTQAAKTPQPLTASV